MPYHNKATKSIKSTPTPVPLHHVPLLSSFRHSIRTPKQPQNNRVTPKNAPKYHLALYRRKNMRSAVKFYCWSRRSFSRQTHLRLGVSEHARRSYGQIDVHEKHHFPQNSVKHTTLKRRCQKKDGASERIVKFLVCFADYRTKKMVRSHSWLKSGQWVHWNMWMVGLTNSRPRSMTWPCSPGQCKMLPREHKLCHKINATADTE